ncbi:MAG: hypothetical protein FWG99_08440 [Treponema sp.]|nr:hypothetical protein [Treponema sp.]
MKNKFVFCILFIAAAAFSYADDGEMYSQIYDMALTNTDQLNVLELIREQEIAMPENFYARALRRLISEYPNVSGATQLHAADNQAMHLSVALANQRQLLAAPDLWLVVDQFSDALVRAEAMAALGRIQAFTYMEQIIAILNEANHVVASDLLYYERVAYGAIVALEGYAHPSCYLPVYFASVGWYPDWVKDQALKSLPIIAEDPSPFMTEIIRSPGYSFEIKLDALQHIEDYDLSEDKKAAIAAVALSEAWRISTSDIRQQNTMHRLRMLSMRMIRDYGAANNTVYPSLERCYNQGLNSTEKEDAINTLAKLANDDSAGLLNKFLMEMNSKLRYGTLNTEDNQMVRIIIPALGSTRNRNGVAALNAVIALDWVPAVKTLAQNALRQIRGN